MQLEINGEIFDYHGEDSDLLVWVLRDRLGLTGTKFGCGIGICGSCTVLIDGKPTRSCITPIKNLAGRKIITIEGLARENSLGEIELHPVQQAFIELQAPQCGWCMSGQMISAVGLLQSNPSPSIDEINDAMNNNYCRCGSYVRIREAIQRAGEIMQAEGSK